MARRFSVGMFLTLMPLAISTMTQAHAVDDFKPAPTNIRNAEYPRVSSDGRVTFRVYAPEAQKVQIDPGGKTVENGIWQMAPNNGYNGLGKAIYDMTKDKDGYWTVTTPPAAPGFHSYFVLIDGADFTDPSSHTYFSSGREASGIEVLKAGLDFYLPKDVPHGQVRTIWHYSKLTEQWRRVYVYVPPNYDARSQQRYPTLYLRHGGGGDETSWIDEGHVNFILDNLIAAGKAKPMIVVMESGYADRPGGTRAANPNPLMDTGDAQRYATVAELTTTETMPTIDANFRTIADRDHRAIAGFSMGSAQALYIGLTNLDKFSAVGPFSRPPNDRFNVQTYYGGVMADAAAFNKKVHLFWWGTGTGEPGIYNAVQVTRTALDKAGIKYSYEEFPGLSHEIPLQREEFRKFATLLFRW